MSALGAVLALHHVSLPVSDLQRSTTFYREILGLHEIERPPFDFPGAWFACGDGQLHLIGEPRDPTFRTDKRADPGDVHFAIRVPSYRDAVAFLEAKGYSADADEADEHRLFLSPHSTTGYPQIYVLDPDRYVIEINAEALDR